MSAPMSSPRSALPRSALSPLRFVPPPALGVGARLAAADRARLAALAAVARSDVEWRCWRALTYLGGTVATTLACLIPLLAGGAARRAGLFTTAVVLLSQGAVHLIKRAVGRPRPRTTGLPTRAAEPDAFSFPSGHSAAAMAVALGYAAALPAAAPVLLLLALLVGLSRAVLGVHYLLDVAAGVLVAVGAAGAVALLGPGLGAGL